MPTAAPDMPRKMLPPPITRHSSTPSRAPTRLPPRCGRPSPGRARTRARPSAPRPTASAAPGGTSGSGWQLAICQHSSIAARPAVVVSLDRSASGSVRSHRSTPDAPRSPGGERIRPRVSPASVREHAVPRRGEDGSSPASALQRRPDLGGEIGGRLLDPFAEREADKAGDPDRRAGLLRRRLDDLGDAASRRR